MVRERLTLKKELKEKVKEIMNEEFLIFLINKYGGGIRELAREIDTSEKMIYLYISQYYLPNFAPKFLRKKAGGYPAFKSIMNTYINFFINDVIFKAEEKGIDAEILLEATMEIIQE